jgi:hypothetical protein
LSYVGLSGWPRLALAATADDTTTDRSR